MGRKKDTFIDSALMNNRTYIQYYNRLTELALSMFEWTGLPKSVDPRFLEMCLFADGKAVFFKDPAMADEYGGEGYLALQVAIEGQLNVYRIPTKRRAYATSGYNKNLDQHDSVIIFNNFMHTNAKLDVEMFSRRLYNLDRIIDVNANAQKTPVLIKCTEDERLTMKNLYMQYDGNEPFIFGESDLNANGLTVLKTDAPYVADKIYQLKTQIWNEALTYLGIMNVNSVKKERLITDEAVRNSGGTIASRYSRLEARRMACKQINEMFGLNIWCDYREDYQEIDEADDTTSGEKGGTESNE